MLKTLIEKASEQRAADRPLPSGVRAHNVGQCVRKLWYMEQGEEPEPMSGRAMRLFDLGHAVERVTAEHLRGALALALGVSEEQVPVIHCERKDGHEVPGLGLTIPDFVIDPKPIASVIPSEMVPTLEADNSKGQRPVTNLAARAEGKLPPVDCKSMSDFAFARLERQQIDEAYACQVEAYMRALDAPWAIIFGVRKETSHIAELVIMRSDERWEWMQQQIKTLDDCRVIGKNVID